MNEAFIRPEDMGVAYRKVKVDLFYSGYYSPDAIINYESDLKSNLDKLREKILAEDQSYFSSPEFLGICFCVPKKISQTEPDSDVEQNTKRGKSTADGKIFCNPSEQWKHAGAKKITAEYRTIANVSLDFHVLAELWILKVGHLFDAKLKDCSYGNRLRRTRENKINYYSLGTFKPYLKAYRDWKNDALNAIDMALEAKKRLITITGDITSFYHSLNPDFLADNDFLKKIGLNFFEDKKTGADCEALNALFINALKAWQKTLPGREKKGLPVGVPASSLIANVALWEFDKTIIEDITPIHFGRYVDDIILVLDNAANITDKNEIWDRLCQRFNLKDELLKNEDDDGITFCPKYHFGSTIRFANEKNKIFIMEGDTGKEYIKSIRREMTQRSSEWRAMPRVDDVDIALVIGDKGEIVDNLREADGLIIQKASFAIKLRNMETLNRDLIPKCWESTRHKFLSSCLDYIFALPHFFDYFRAIPRIIRLATSCEDFDILRQVLEKIDSICAILSDRNNCSTSKELRDYRGFHNHLLNLIRESIISSFPLRLSANGKKQWLDTFDDFEPKNLCFDRSKLLNIKELQSLSKEYYLHDIGMWPFKTYFFNRKDKRFSLAQKDVLNSLIDVAGIIHGRVINGLRILNKSARDTSISAGVIFATRPINLFEIYILYNDMSCDLWTDGIGKLIFALRGFSPTKDMPKYTTGVLKIDDADKPLDKIGIATACWMTDFDSWKAAVVNIPDPNGHERYKRFAKLIDEVLAKGKDCHYFVMPELSVPFAWFLTAALKLKRRGISFIAGVEYFHRRKKKISNQVWASLLHDSLGFPSLMLYCQDKQTPALHEKHGIEQISGEKFQPEVSWLNPPVIQHGNLFFAILVCSELTNIAYRAFLRGKIDVLFIPAWNKDLETFNALVESTALDVHAYISVCNDRTYGDSRIRCPHENSWRRDIIRIKGGSCDYLVTAFIDVKSLRQFQSGHESPSEPFKPVPDGFKIASARRLLPLSEVAK